MIVSADLFKSEELRAWSFENALSGQCEVSGNTSMLIDTTILSGYFTAFLSLFEEDPYGRELSEVIQKDWDMFVNDDMAKRVVSVLLNECGIPLTDVSKVKYKKNVIEPCDRWDNIKNVLKTERRFFAGELVKDPDLKWDMFFASNYTIKRGTVYKRARINDDEENLYVSESQLGMPPASKATAGRANTYGIPYLYLGDNDQTVMYESRALLKDILSIASFKITEDLDVVDFTFKPDLFAVFMESEDDFLSEVQRYVFLNEIAKDLSKAVRRYDNKEIDYLPTQFVCEYIRLITAAKGLIFQSAQYPEGKNIVLFNDEDVCFEAVEHKVVGKVRMSYSV